MMIVIAVVYALAAVAVIWAFLLKGPQPVKIAGIALLIVGAVIHTIYNFNYKPRR